MKLIDKDALVAEIKRQMKYNGTRAELDRSAFMAGRAEEDKDILAFLDTLEVKKVDLERSHLLKSTENCFLKSAMPSLTTMAIPT